jgi:uncharacterized membrane-anchored protein
MNKAWITRGLVAAIVFQIAILASVYLNSIYPVWVGQEIRMKAKPVDPRSLFRGNYARMTYDISRIQQEKLHDKDKPRLRTGEIVYVKLKKGEDGLYVANGASLSRPESGLFIRGRIQFYRWAYREKKSYYTVRYGIEAFFAKKKKALKLERELRDNGVAVVMIASNGKATLQDVITNNTKTTK